MIDSGLSDAVGGDDAFASCEFEERSDAADDSFSLTSDDDVEEDFDVGVNVNVRIGGNDDDSFSSYSEDYEDHGDVEDQPEESPRRFSFEDERSHSTSSVYVQPKRSGYAARRCKSVDMMTHRLMIHADDFYHNRPVKTSRRSLAMFAGIVFALGALVATGVMLGLSHHHYHQPPKANPVTPIVPDPSIADADTLPGPIPTNIGSSTTWGPVPENPVAYDKTSEMIKVPFANQHNLRYDGVLFVKDSGKNIAAPHHNPAALSVFDAYAKTLDPITELHFAPGESNTTKHIVLTTTQPDLKLNSIIEQHPTRDMASDPGVVLSIGLESNGELWLPHSTGQNILEFETNLAIQKQKHHFSHLMLKRIYGAGDSFVLTVTDETISLFRNNYQELVGMWQNPIKAAPRSSNPLSGQRPSSTKAQLYAQVWFKESKSSMVVHAWHDDRRSHSNNNDFP